MSEEKETREQAKTIRELIAEGREYYERDIKNWGRDRLGQALTWLDAEQKLSQAEIDGLGSQLLALQQQCIQLRKNFGAEQKEKEQLKKRFDCLSKLVIFRDPELWEDYLVDVKQALAGKSK